MFIQEFIQCLHNKEIVLICVGQGYNKEYKAKYNRYSIKINRNGIIEDVEMINILSERNKLSYYGKRTGVMTMTYWGRGTSQEFEAQGAITNLCMRAEIDRYDSDYFYKNVKNIQVIY